MKIHAVFFEKKDDCGTAIEEHALLVAPFGGGDIVVLDLTDEHGADLDLHGVAEVPGLKEGLLPAVRRENVFSLESYGTDGVKLALDELGLSDFAVIEEEISVIVIDAEPEYETKTVFEHFRFFGRIKKISDLVVALLYGEYSVPVDREDRKEAVARRYKGFGVHVDRTKLGVDLTGKEIVEVVVRTVLILG